MQIERDQALPSSEVELADLFKVIWHRKLFLIVFVSLLSVLAYMFIKTIPNVYRASVVIMLKAPSKSTDAIQSLLTGAITAAENTETELQLIKSKYILSRVSEELSLKKHPAFLPAHSSQADILNLQASEESVIRQLSNKLSVSHIAGSDLIKISFESHYPELSALVANSVGETFIEYKETLTAGKHKQGAKFLATKLGEVKTSLELAEQRIIEYQSTHNFVDISSASTLATSKLTKLHNKRDLLLAEIEKLKISKSHILQNKYNLQSLLLLPVLSDASAISSHQQEYKKLSQKFSEVKLRYGPKHPKYIAAEKMLASTDQKLQSLVNEETGRIDKQLDIKARQVEFFDSELNKLTLRLNELGFVEFDYEKLKKEFNANLELYENLVRKQTESELMQDLTDASHSILIEPAAVERTPIKPNRTVLLALAILASFVLGSCIVLLDFFMGNKVIKFRRLAVKYNTKVIGNIPKLNRGRKGVITRVSATKSPRFLESIRSIRTSILLDKERSKHEIIAITSISPNDGKSSIAFQLSKCFAEVGSTLLVDADLRYPSIAKAIKEEVERPGLTNLIVHSHSLKDAIIKLEEEKIDVITSGHIPKNPLGFLQHRRFGGLMNGLKKKYQRILLECPPIMSVSDAFIVSKYVDSIYLVVDVSKAQTEDLANVLDELEQADVNVGGIILNKVKEKKGYGPAYQYGYYGRAGR